MNFKTIKTLNKEKGYNGEIKSGALTGKVQEKFIVTGKSATDERTSSDDWLLSWCD